MRALPKIVLAAAVAGCGGPQGPPPAGTLSYGFPSPPAAVYQIADTVAGEVNLLGNLEIAGGYSLTLNLAFEQDLAGVRVRGIADSFEGSLSDPAQAALSADLGYLAGTLDFVMNRHGVVEVTSFPESTGPDEEVFSFAGLPYDLFPHLPDSIVDRGGNWADSVKWHTDGRRAEMTSKPAYTYTLVGDTLVDDRWLLHIAFAGKVDIVTVTGRPGKATYRHMKGSATGLVLWDPERRLVAYQQYERDLRGTVTRPDRPLFGVRLAGTVRIRLLR